MRILIVDDKARIATAIERGPLAEGFEVDLARGGEEGLRQAREGAHAAIILIILDVLLPKMRGYDVCETLREEAVNTPILILAAKSGSVTRLRGWTPAPCWIRISNRRPTYLAPARL